MTTARQRQKTDGEDDTSVTAWPDLEAKLGHHFERPELLELALTHRSYTYEGRHGVPTVIVPEHPEPTTSSWSFWAMRCSAW